MSPKVVRYSIVAALVLSIIFIFIDTRVTAGILLGSIFSYIYLYLLHKSYDNLLNKDISKKSMFFKVMLRMMVLVVPLLISCLLPQIFNIFGAFAGLILFKFVMYADSFIKRKQ